MYPKTLKRYGYRSVSPRSGGAHCHRSTLRMLLLLLSAIGLAACGDSSERGSAAAAAQGVAAIDGETIYNRNCYSCHAAGVAGAPKVGVAEDWQPRAAKGPAALLASTIQGVPPGMPAKGLCSRCSQTELTAAIDHMLAASGIRYPAAGSNSGEAAAQDSSEAGTSGT